MPEITAEALEAHIWRTVRALFENRDRFEEALRRAADGGEQAERHEHQTATLRAEIGRLERRIANAAEVMLDFGRGTAPYDHAKQASIRDERTKVELATSLARLETERPHVLEADEAERLRALWVEYADALTEADEQPSEQRALYRVLVKAGTLTLAEPGDVEGVQIGTKHRFLIDLRGPAGLSGDGQNPCGFLLEWDSQDAGAAVRVVPADRTA